MDTPFKFYDNTLAFSMGTKPVKKKIKSDLMLSGDMELLCKGLLDQMDRHPMLAELVTMAAFNYMQEHGRPPITLKNEPR